MSYSMCLWFLCFSKNALCTVRQTPAPYSDADLYRNISRRCIMHVFEFIVTEGTSIFNIGVPRLPSSTGTHTDFHAIRKKIIVDFIFQIVEHYVWLYAYLIII